MISVATIGFLCGFVFSMPVAGPISILVFGRGLQDRARSGLYLALGGALAESVYAYLAFWGAGELFARHAWIEPFSRGLASILLTVLGLRFLFRRARPDVDMQLPGPPVGHKRSFLLGLTITALNPTLMASWLTAVTFARSFHFLDFRSARALPFSVGVLLGIFGWFAVLLMLLGRYRSRFSRKTLDATIRFMGAALALLGVFFAGRFIKYLIAGG